MNKRFVFGLGLTLGFCVGATHAVGKMMSVDEIRKACANRVGDRISDFLYGKNCCVYSYNWSFGAQGDCENAWHDICELIQLYGLVTVADVKEIVGSKSHSYLQEPPDPTASQAPDDGSRARSRISSGSFCLLPMQSHKYPYKI